MAIPQAISESDSTTTRYGAVVLASNIDRIYLAGRGTRHSTVFTTSLVVGNYVAGGEISGDEAYRRLFSAAKSLLSPANAAKTVSDGLSRGFRNPKNPVDKRILGVVQGREHARQEATRWLQAVMTSKTTSPTAKTILWAIGTTCIKHGRYKVSESHRQLAESAGVALSSISRLLPELNEWVLRSPWQPPDEPEGAESPAPVEPVDPQGMATVWQIRQIHDDDVPLAGIPDGDPTNDYWHKRHAWWILYSMLDPDELHCPKDLAKACGRSLSSVYRILKQFIADGLVERIDGAVRRLEEAVLPDPTMSWDIMREERHHAHRVRWRKYLKQKAEDNAYARALPKKDREAFRKMLRNAKGVPKMRARAHDFWRRRSGRPLGTVRFDSVPTADRSDFYDFIPIVA